MTPHFNIKNHIIMKQLLNYSGGILDRKKKFKIIYKKVSL